jgi:putative DNA primase/helicase
VPLVSIDNCNGELGGSALCTMITQPVMRVRILGKSEAPEFDNRATVFATGNNLRLVGDMTHRAILCDLDANMEKPEKRSFDFDPIEYVASMRGDYIAAAIIIVRAYQGAGCPTPCLPLAGFEDWSRLVRAPLVWLGEEDAAETRTLLRMKTRKGPPSSRFYSSGRRRCLRCANTLRRRCWPKQKTATRADVSTRTPRSVTPSSR